MSAIHVLQSADGARASVHDQGAQLTSWCPAGGGERLFLSSRSSFDPGSAIRGGVPIIFPQFAALGPLPKHGFARNCAWTRVEARTGQARWQLESNETTRALWPQDFICEFELSIGGSRLQMDLRVTNTDMDRICFTAALHSYLRVQAIDEVSLLGLQHLRYRDKTRQDSEHVQAEALLQIEGEVDRIYFDTPAALQLIEPTRRLSIGQQGFSDTVVWNPGAAAGAALADLEVDGYRRMLCVEAAAVKTPISLPPGGQWQGSQTLIAE